MHTIGSIYLVKQYKIKMLAHEFYCRDDSLDFVAPGRFSSQLEFSDVFASFKIYSATPNVGYVLDTLDLLLYCTVLE